MREGEYRIFFLYLCVPSRAREIHKNETQKKNLYLKI